MDTSCPKKSLESVEEAEMPFEETTGTFLTPNLERTKDGIITEAQFDKLFKRAKEAGKYIDFNSYSFETLLDSIQREFCYAQQRYIFYLTAYQDSVKKGQKDTKFLEKSKVFNQQMQDLLTSMLYMDQAAIEGKQAPLVTPTLPTDPFAFKAWYDAIKKGQSSTPEEYEKARQDLIRIQNAIATGKYAEDIRESMADFENEVKLRQDQVTNTREKNRFATAQLSLYTFANLAAVGLLLYFFRAKT